MAMNFQKYIINSYCKRMLGNLSLFVSPLLTFFQNLFVSKDYFMNTNRVSNGLISHQGLALCRS